jgi:cytochrome c5
VAISSRRRTTALIAAAWSVCILSAGVHGRSSRLPEVQDPPVRAEELPPGDGARIVRSKCLACHGVDLIVQQRLSLAAWGREVEKMIGWGAIVESSEREQLVDYLEAHFGQSTPRRRPGVSPQPGATILEARCLTCHDERLIEQQRLTAAGWAAELEKMIRWGATLTEPEKAVLIDYLTGSRPPSRLASPR